MNKIEDGNRMKFIIAVMTKDYSKAEIIGKSILEKDPSNNVIQHYMTLLQDLNLTRRIRESDSSVLNDESTSESGESDSEMTVNDVKDDLNLDEHDYKIDFHTEKFCQSANSSESLSVHLKKKFSILLHNKGMSCNFEKKIYRVLPIKLNKKSLQKYKGGVVINYEQRFIFSTSS